MVKSSSTTTHAPHAVGTLRDKVAIQPAREASECIPFPDFGEVPSLPSMQNATITTPSALLFVGQGAQKIGMTADVSFCTESCRKPIARCSFDAHFTATEPCPLAHRHPLPFPRPFPERLCICRKLQGCTKLPNEFLVTI